MEEIFISYRRADTQAEAGRLFEHLEAAFGAGTVFKDVDSILGGKDFREVIEERLRSCKVVLALIGPGWLDARLPDGSRRLDDPEDYVRMEIETALEQGKLVIPVLVGETVIPPEEALPGSLKKLRHRNALNLRQDPDFKTDSERITGHIAKSVGLRFLKKVSLNPLWLIPATITVAAKWSDAFGIAHLLAEVFRRWLDIGHVVWAHVFAWLKPYTVRTLPPEDYPFLTLIAVLLGSVGIGQLVQSKLAGRSWSPLTVSNMIQHWLRRDNPPSGIICNVLIISAFAFIAFPVKNSLLGAFGYVVEASQSFFTPSPGASQFFSAMLSILWTLIWIVVFVRFDAIDCRETLRTSRRTLDRLLYIRLQHFERKTFQYSIFALLAYFVFLVLYFFAPNTVFPMDHSAILLPTLFVTFTLIAWRSAAPMVQLALSAAGLLAADRLVTFAIDVLKEVKILG